MFRNLKYFLTGVLFTIILFVGSIGAAESTLKTIEAKVNSVKVKIYGKPMPTDNLLIDGITYVPLRTTVEMLGKEIKWDPQSQTADVRDPYPTAVNSRLSPAKKGEKITIIHNDFTCGKQILEITLLDLLRGDKAWSKIKAANSYNEPPAEGKEYIIAKFRIRVLDTENDKPVRISHSSFDIVRSDGTVYNDIFYIAGLNPNLSTDLYKGADYEGWTYFMVDINDTPLAAIFRNYESATWFDISS